MKSTELAIAHNIPVDEFNEFVQQTATFPIKKNILGGIIIPDDVDTEILVKAFLDYQEEKLRHDRAEANRVLQEYIDQKDQLRFQQEEVERKQREDLYHLRVEGLKAKGADGYYEYKAVSLLDVGGIFKSNSGRVNIEAMTQTLNELGIDGWHLVTAYSNELGKNALSGGAGGVLLGVNSTVDENILIFERFVKI